MDCKYDLFISYSRKDTDVVKSIVTKLQTHGFTVWIDENGVESGDAFKSVIAGAIKESKLFLFFSSISSNESHWTIKEVNLAVHLRKEIIPVKLDGTEYCDSILFDLAGLDYIDYANLEKRDAFIDKLIKSISLKTGKGYVCEQKEAINLRRLNSEFFELGYDIAVYVIHKLRGQTDEHDDAEIRNKMQAFQLEPNILLKLEGANEMMQRLNRCAYKLGQQFGKNAENSVCLGILFVLSVIAKRSNVNNAFGHTYDDAIVLSCKHLGVTEHFISKLINATADEMEKMYEAINIMLDALAVTTYPCKVCGSPLAKDYQECPTCLNKLDV